MRLPCSCGARNDVPPTYGKLPDVGIPGNPFEFFLKEAKIALNDGVAFGKGGQGFVRLNFGCPRSTLEEALGRMKTALMTLK